jgi:hypothetical protein
VWWRKIPFNEGPFRVKQKQAFVIAESDWGLWVVHFQFRTFCPSEYKKGSHLLRWLGEAWNGTSFCAIVVWWRRGALYLVCWEGDHLSEGGLAVKKSPLSCVLKKVAGLSFWCVSWCRIEPALSLFDLVRGLGSLQMIGGQNTTCRQKPRVR